MPCGPRVWALGNGLVRRTGTLMDAILNFSEFIVQNLLGFIEFLVIANAIMSWLIAFNVVNLRHPVVAQIARALDAICRPLLRPIQRVLPVLGGLDLSPLVLILVIEGARSYLIPPLFYWLHTLAGGALSA